MAQIIGHMMMVAALHGGLATAQDVERPSVLLTEMDATELLQPWVDELNGQLTTELASHFRVISPAEAPPLQDVSAELYLASCPAGGEVGCTFVVGERAGVDWALLGELHAEEPAEVDLLAEDPLPVGPVSVTVRFVDIASAEVVASIQAELQGEDAAGVAQGITRALTELSVEGTERADVRGEVIDAKEAHARRLALQERMAETLQGLDADFQPEVRRTTIERPRLKTEDLAKYEMAEALSPWERFNMTQRQYVRFVNSGLDMAEWNRRRRGRAGQLTLRALGGVGVGPYRESFDGRWALDSDDLQVRQILTSQELVSGSTLLAQIEVGFGVLPFLEVGGLLGARKSQFTYLLHQEVVGEPEEPGAFSQTAFQAPQFGFFAHVAPLPASAFRPTLTGALVYWRGAPITRVVTPESIQPVEALPAPSLTSLQLSPGAEVRVGPNLVFFARAAFAIPLSGTEPQVRVETFGPGEVFFRAALEEKPGIGIEAVGGVLVTIGPVGAAPRPKR